jgi:aldehyde dehydrogenase (NAD+)
VDQAVVSAREALPGWKGLPPRTRGYLLQKAAALIREHAVELATLESLNNGKLFRESWEDDLPEAADVFDYYAGWTDKIYGATAPVPAPQLNYTLREPCGVCALIVPWNFPLLMACWKLAPALACGNTVLIKPSPFTSLSLIRFLELLHQAELFPKGVIHLLLGDAEAGQALSEHPHVDKIAFTGSTATGKRVVAGAASSNLKRVTLELGGKSPNIIFEDVEDMSLAIERSFTAMFSHKGEKCSEPTRWLVHESRYPKVLDEVTRLADATVCGNPFDPASGQGPQCHKAHFEKILHYIELGKKEGAPLACGGVADRSRDNARGYYIRPTVFYDVQNSMKIAQDEIFGPVLCVSSFKTEEEAIHRANQTSYGLAAGIWTQDVSRAHRVAGRLEAGMVFVNKYGMYDFASPFGGFKQSGWGKEMGIDSLAEYTQTKSVWVHLG